jgi:hypothetical protein
MCRQCVRLAVAVAIAASTLYSTSGTGSASGIAGHWAITYSATCMNSPQNVALCRALFGNLKAIGKRKTTLTLQGSDDYTVLGSGKYTDIGRFTLIEIAPAGKPTNCGTDPGVRLFHGRCVITSAGRGHVARGPRGVSIFYEDFEKVQILGVTKAVQVTGAAANSGPPAPVQSGRYSMVWIASALGFKAVPTGVTGGFIMIHTR